MLCLHQERMLTALSTFNWPKTARDVLSNLHKDLVDHLKQRYDDPCYGAPLKLRVTLSSSGNIDVVSTPTPGVTLGTLFPLDFDDLFTHLPTFNVFVSPITTTPSLFTSHKTTNRAQYDQVRSLIPVTSNHSNEQRSTRFAEILLINRNAEIMEGSITTPYFLRAGEWITPSAQCGGNLGTTRRYALEADLCKESIVTRESVQAGEKVVLSNGVRGFGWGYMEALENIRENETIKTDKVSLPKR